MMKNTADDKQSREICCIEPETPVQSAGHNIQQKELELKLGKNLNVI